MVVPLSPNYGYQRGDFVQGLFDPSVVLWWDQKNESIAAAVYETANNFGVLRCAEQ